MTPRAPALPPEQRRAAILAAARPLIIDHGSALTTKQVAEAAGIAEGTLFRIFATKADLLCAIIHDVLDPAPAIGEFADIQATDATEATRQVLAVLERYIATTHALFAALHTSQSAAADPKPSAQDFRAAHLERMHRVHEAIAETLIPFAAELRRPVLQVAQHLTAVAFSTFHPFHSLTPVAVDEVTDLVVHGIVQETP